MKKHFAIAALAAVLSASPTAAQEDAALIMRVSGDVQVRHAGAAATPASVGLRLAAGDEVRPAAGSRAILLTRTGATMNVTEATTLQAPSGGGNPDLFDRAVQTLARAASSDARTAGGRQGMIRPIPGEPVLVAPRNGLMVATTRPTFRWMPVDGATDYTIQIRRTDGGQPVRYSAGNVTEWTVPAGAPALLPGATYAWTVAPSQGRPTREQQFRVIGPDEYAELASSLSGLAALGLDPMGDGLFLSAIVYRDLGLIYDANAALAGLESASEGEFTADLYLLKGEILNQLGMAEEATAAFDKADALLR